MCDNVSSSLIAQNAFGCADPNVILHTSLVNECNSLGPLDQFNQYCLIPSALPIYPVCDSSLRTEATFIFNEMQKGEFKTLQQLPIVWQSAPAVVDEKSLWVAVPPNSNEYLQYGGQLHFMDVHPSLNGAQFIIAIQVTTGFAFELEADGLWYRVPITPPTENQFFYSCDISQDGALRVFASENNYFIWRAAHPEWTLAGPVANSVAILNVKAWDDDQQNEWLAILSRTASAVNITVFKNSYDTPFIEQALPSAGTGWTGGTLMLSDDGKSLFCALNTAFPLGSTGAIYVTYIGLYATAASFFKSVIRAANTFSSSISFFTTPSSVIHGSPGVDSTFDLLYLVPNRGAFFCSVPAGAGAMTITVYNSAIYEGRITSNEGNTIQTYIVTGGTGSSLRLRNWNTGDTYDVTPLSIFPGGLSNDGTTSFVVAGNGSLVLSYEDRLWMNYDTITGDQLWNTGAMWRMYPSMHVSDLGRPNLQDDAQYNPGPNWYMGLYNNTSIPAPTPTVINGSYYSFHNRYNVRTTVTEGNPSTRPLRTPVIPESSPPSLYRSNEVYLIQQSNIYETRLFSNGNVKIYDKTVTPNVLAWENNMKDGFNAEETYTVVNTTRPTVSPTGVYITYWAEDGTFVECYYPYNNLRFRDYSATNDSIFSNAIEAQSAYCYANLQIDPNNELNFRFSDNRCACIGGLTLFERVFINTDLLPDAEKALLLDNLPCMMIDCTQSRINFDPTNIARLMADKCKLPITICSNIIRAEDAAAVGNIEINQNCGSETAACDSNDDCPFGELCLSGKCWMTCHDKSDCKANGSTVFDCLNETCVPLGQNSPYETTVLSLGAIIGIVVGVVVVVVIIAVLLWYFLVKKKQAK